MSTSLDLLIVDKMELFKKYLDRTNMEHKEYQYEGVKWCLTNELRKDPLCNVRGGFIADEMGLGKTIMMIGTFITNYLPKTLVVVPPVLIDQWYLQIYRTTGHKSLIYHGEDKKTITIETLQMATIVITTYDAISVRNKKTGLLHNIKWSRIVFDEAHHLRNRKTTRYIGAQMLKSKIRWLVSGTPVQNKKKDFYNLCAALKLPASFYTEADNLLPLARAFILKRTKKQVGIQIPDVVLDKSMVAWKNKNEMELSEQIHAALAFSRVSDKKSNGIIINNFKEKGPLALMLRARQTCIFPKLMMNYLDKLIQSGKILDYSTYKEAFDHSSKLDSVVESILERKGNGSGKLIFCHFREEIDEIAMRLRRGGMTNIATFDGRTSQGKRHDILNDKTEALLLQIQTGCEGLNLQENYSEIYFISPHWNPAIEEQAIARCHRIGQTKTVFVQRFEMCNFIKEADQEMETMTVDTYVNSVQDFKKSIANECIA